MPRGTVFVEGSISGSGTPTTASVGVEAETWGTKTGSRVQHTQKAQFSGHESAAEPRVSSTQPSKTPLASRSVL